MLSPFNAGMHAHPIVRHRTPLTVLGAVLLMSACATVAPPPEPESTPVRPDATPAPTGAQTSGRITRPATRIPSRPVRPDGAAGEADGEETGAVPRREPLHRSANRPYRLNGRQYRPMTALAPFTEQGIASWYGKPFHGRRTANGERYNMNAMTAAHPTLPLPSYARVRNLDTGATVVVRVNDRGPFSPNRVIDLSHAAASRLGMLDAGLASVQVELILPEPDNAIELVAEQEAMRTPTR